MPILRGIAPGERLLGAGRAMKYGPGFLALAGSLILLATSFRAGWTREETDFPNYYTAAWLVRKGAPLHLYYDWTWFQRQTNYAGIERQLTAYTPNTPLTMAPMIPLAGLSPQNAKRAWLALNLGFLAATIWLLSRLTRFRFAEISLLAVGGFGALHSNFLFGQYYICILFLVTTAFYCLLRRRDCTAGFLLAATFGLKLYGGPFLLYLAAKRRWRAAAAMAASVLLLAGAAIAMFGWRDMTTYAVHILPRAVQGEIVDPYHPGNGTLTALLRRSLVMEPELNPRPWQNAPEVFFFLQPLLILSIVALPLLGVWQSDAAGRRGLSNHANDEQALQRDFAWFSLVLPLASPTVASYVFILLLLPVTLLLEKARGWENIFLVAVYVLLCAPLPDAWMRLFPKVWLLVALFLFAGRGSWRRIGWKPALAAAALVAGGAGLAAQKKYESYRDEPGRRWQRLAVEPGAVYSSRPVVLRSGVVYESIGEDRYVLRWLHGGRIKVFSFQGHAIHPRALSSDGPVQFELVAHRASTVMSLEPGSGQAVAMPATVQNDQEAPVASPDGQWLAIVTDADGPRHIRLRSGDGSRKVLLAGGDCDSFAPAWELDSRALLFASDCGRGMGLPALYRAQLDRLTDP